jgi:uncharacterized protein YcfJ
MRKSGFLVLLSLAFTGCAQLERPLTDAALAAGGAAVGNQIGHGDPLATAGGAAAGVLVGEGIHAWKTRREQSAYRQGFEKGRSDGIKQLYWNLQAQHRNPPDQRFEVTVPEHQDGGVLFNETKQTIQK